MKTYDVKKRIIYFFILVSLIIFSTTTVGQVKEYDSENSSLFFARFS